MNGLATIYALSSGSGRAGIAVVRLSGPSSFVIAAQLVSDLPPDRQAGLRKIQSVSGELIDVALVLRFAGPKTATGEDLVEFHLHGSPAVVQRLMMELGGFENCRPALPGEFTRRAYANERMDLVEVEGLADLLASETDAQRRLAMRQFSGEASSVYLGWYRDLVSVLAIIEAAIDFADEDGVAEQALVLAVPRVEAFRDMLMDALAQSERAAVVRKGVRVVIAGAPNVGKSSLLNALAGRKAAIVSEIAGTTRDVVEAAVMVAGLPVMLADTAGLRDDTNDLIEREGMARSRSEIDDADILLWVESATDRQGVIPPREPDLWVVNKADSVSRESIHVRNDTGLAVSALSGLGLPELRLKLSGLVETRTYVGENAIMVRERHRAAIAESIRNLNDALAKKSGALELMAEDVRKAAAALSSITGRVDVEDFLGQIFSEFCIGK